MENVSPEQDQNWMVKLDLGKYNLSHLENKKLLAWTEIEINRYVDALAAENIAPIVRLPFQPKIIKALLAQSYCRKCGSCCTLNDFSIDDPGILVFERELKLIAKHTTYSYKQLRKLSVKYNNPERDDTRYLSLPCIFHKKGICTIYDLRPFICRIYPIKDTPPVNGQVYITISLRCEYGKDIYKSAIQKNKDATNRRRLSA